MTSDITHDLSHEADGEEELSIEGEGTMFTKRSNRSSFDRRLHSGIEDEYRDYLPFLSDEIPRARRQF